MRVRALSCLWLLALMVATAHAQSAPQGGAAITPEFAKSLFDKIAPLQENDGCRLADFSTSRFSVSIGLRTASAELRQLQLGTAAGTATTGGPRERRIGSWVLTVPAESESDCAATVAAIAAQLAMVSAPSEQPWKAGRWTSVRQNYDLIAAQFLLLALWTVAILYRQARASNAPRAPIAALTAIWGAGLALRLTVSPREFLHEYYHIAETLLANLRGQAGPVYGDAGPALYQLAAAAVGRPDHAAVIFATNAVLASLAIPALALLDLAVYGRWSRALCGAALLCVLPQHLRFSASEVLFVPAVTLALWAMALAVLYLRSGKLGDALCAAIAMSVAIQTRPEMTFLPFTLLALVLLTQPRSLRALLDWRVLAALALLTALLIPRFFELSQILHSQQIPPHTAPTWNRLWHSAVLFQKRVTPAPYWVLLGAGTLWALRRSPGLILWTAAVVIGYCGFSLASGDNPPYDIRSQLLPNSLTALLAAGAAPLWMALWGSKRSGAIGVGSALLVAVAIGMVAPSRGFITGIGDQQLEWHFLERAVPNLPDHATLLTSTAIGDDLDAFPEVLLQASHKSYRLVDLHQAVAGDTAWPDAGDRVLLFYQGMFCYFAFHDQPAPVPMTAPCLEVHRRYRSRPLRVTELDTTGFSALRYADPPYAIGFYLLEPMR